MTDICHSSTLLPVTVDTRAPANWNSITVALAAIFLVLAAAHLLGPTSGVSSQVNSFETGTAKLDGRGKWIGYM